MLTVLILRVIANSYLRTIKCLARLSLNIVITCYEINRRKKVKGRRGRKRRHKMEEKWKRIKSEKTKWWWKRKEGEKRRKIEEAEEKKRRGKEEKRKEESEVFDAIKKRKTIYKTGVTVMVTAGTNYDEMWCEVMPLHDFSFTDWRFHYVTTYISISSTGFQPRLIVDQSSSLSEVRKRVEQKWIIYFAT